MRVRNPKTGTVISLDTETANAYVAGGGWERTDEEPTSGTTSTASDRDTRSTSEPRESRTRRRRASK